MAASLLARSNLRSHQKRHRVRTPCSRTRSPHRLWHSRCGTSCDGHQTFNARPHDTVPAENRLVHECHTGSVRRQHQSCQTPHDSYVSRTSRRGAVDVGSRPFSQDRTEPRPRDAPDGDRKGLVTSGQSSPRGVRFGNTDGMGFVLLIESCSTAPVSRPAPFPPHHVSPCRHTPTRLPALWGCGVFGRTRGVLVATVRAVINHKSSRPSAGDGFCSLGGTGLSTRDCEITSTSAMRQPCGRATTR